MTGRERQAKFRVLAWLIFFGTLGAVDLRWDLSSPPRSTIHIYRYRPMGRLGHRMLRAMTAHVWNSRLRKNRWGVAKFGDFGKNTTWKTLPGKITVSVTPNGPNDGGDYGKFTLGTVSGGINEAGAAVKAAGGGNVNIRTGGQGNSIAITGTTYFYAGVNYQGDGGSLLATGGLANPFSTDPNNINYGCELRDLILDGGSVAGTAVFTQLSAVNCNFQNLTIQNAGSATISVPNTGPFTYTNPNAALPQVVTLFGGAGVTITSVNGFSTTQTSGWWVLPAGASISITYTANSPPTMLQLGVGLALTGSTTIPTSGRHKNAGVANSTFTTTYITGSTCGLLLAGAGSGKVTNNTFSNLNIDTYTNTGTNVPNAQVNIAFGYNADSNQFGRVRCAMYGQANCVGVLYNGLNATNTGAANSLLYDNEIAFLTIDCGTGTAGQVGVQFGVAGSYGTWIRKFAHDAGLPTNVVFASTKGGYYINDIATQQIMAQDFNNRSTTAWHSDTAPSFGTGYTYGNQQFAFYVIVTAYNGCTGVSINGQSIGTPAAPFLVKPGDTLLFSGSGVVPTISSQIYGLTG